MKLKNLLLFFVFAIGSASFLNAQTTVTLTGKAPEYHGYKIEIFRFLDGISKQKQLVTSFKIADDGSFSSTFPLEEITYIFTQFDAYKASLFLKPGEKYDLIFPPIKKVAANQKRNPFFNPDEISFALKNSDSSELNRLIQQFEIAYLKEESRYFNQIYNLHSAAAVDSLKIHLQQLFEKTNQPYFEQYKFYRTAFAEFTLHQGQSDTFAKTYFINQKPDLLVPPCQRLFSQVFSDYFAFAGNQIRNDDFKKLVAQSNLSGLENYLVTQNRWDANLSRLVILRGINDAYFQGQFSQKSLMRLLDKIATSQWNLTQKSIAKRLKDQLTYLQAGSSAPDFSMTDFSGNKHQLSDFSDKYVYLNFTRVANPICRQHLDQMKQFSPQLANELHILNLILPEEADKKELIQQQNWKGNFFIVDEKTADTYRVTNFPIAYLIDKKRQLILSPAPNPLDGFEQQFLNILKQKHLEDLRNQSK